MPKNERYVAVVMLVKRVDGEEEVVKRKSFAYFGRSEPATRAFVRTVAQLTGKEQQ